MKRFLTAAAPLLAAALLSVSPALAASSKHSPSSATCKRIDSALAAGKSTTQVEKQLKVSSKTIAHCQKNMAAASTSGAEQAR